KRARPAQVYPTAQASPSDAIPTPESAAPNKRVVLDHFLPFQLMILSDLITPWPTGITPEASDSARVAEIGSNAVKPVRRMCLATTGGTPICDHWVPFQWTTSSWC